MGQAQPGEAPLDDSAPRKYDVNGLPCEAWLCRAQSKQKGQRCQQWREPGFRVCKFHGGAGSGAPIKHGRYSKRLGRYKDAYEQALSDPTLLDLKEPIALLDSLVHRHAERAHQSDTHEFRARALEHYEEAARATKLNDQLGVVTALNALGALLREGVAEDRAMVTLAVEVDRLARRIEGAWQVRLARKQAINAKDLVVVFTRLVDVIRQEAPADVASRLIRRIDADVLGPAGHN